MGDEEKRGTMLKRKIVYLCICLTCMFLCGCSGSADEVILIGSQEGVISTDSSGDGEETSSQGIADEHISVRLEKNRREMTSTVNIFSVDEADAQEMIRIYICGAVIAPGVVEIPQGSRKEDALAAAGGFAENADRTYVNLADWVQDGEMVYFPTEEEVNSGQIGITRGPAQVFITQSLAVDENGLVNINTADATLLCTLPGIGESRAADIIAYREENGFFQSCEDIMSVPGIKTGLYEKICDKITVDERVVP